MKALEELCAVAVAEAEADTNRLVAIAASKPVFNAKKFSEKELIEGSKRHIRQYGHDISNSYQDELDNRHAATRGLNSFSYTIPANAIHPLAGKTVTNGKLVVKDNEDMILFAGKNPSKDPAKYRNGDLFIKVNGKPELMTAVADYNKKVKDIMDGLAFAKKEEPTPSAKMNDGVEYDAWGEPINMRADLKPKLTTKGDILRRAWVIAREVAVAHGGSAKSALSMSLKQAWVEFRAQQNGVAIMSKETISITLSFKGVFMMRFDDYETKRIRISRKEAIERIELARQQGKMSTDDGDFFTNSAKIWVYYN